MAMHMTHEVDMYDPTPEEIRECCKAIQAKWSPEDEAKRRGRCAKDIRQGMFWVTAPAYSITSDGIDAVAPTELG